MKRKALLLSTSLFLLGVSQFASASTTVECTVENGSVPITFEVSEDLSKVDGSGQNMETLESVAFTLPCQSSVENKTMRCEGVFMSNGDDNFSVSTPVVLTKESDDSFNFKFLPLILTFPTEVDGEAMPDEFVEALKAMFEPISEMLTSIEFTCKSK